VLVGRSWALALEKKTLGYSLACSSAYGRAPFLVTGDGSVENPLGSTLCELVLLGHIGAFPRGAPVRGLAVSKGLPGQKAAREQEKVTM
jgi:hypothetical protein